MKIYVQHDDMLGHDDTSKFIDYVTIAKFDTVGFLHYRHLRTEWKYTQVT